MAVRDLLWACPFCKTPEGIVPNGRGERCLACGARFRRSRGARIMAEAGGRRVELHASDWFARVGPAISPAPGPDGVILTAKSARVKIARQQRPVWFCGELLGIIERFDRPQVGRVVLRLDEVCFEPDGAPPVHWPVADLTAVQPASSSLQIALSGMVVSLRFLTGSVRLWTRAITDRVIAFHRAQGDEVLELQPRIRTRPAP